MKFAALFLLTAAASFAAVSGTVTNTTTGKPQPNVILQLIQPGQGGMQTLGTTKTGPDGSFKFDKDVEGPRLVQAIYGGVTYTRMVPPGAPSNDVKITVEDSTNDPAAAKATDHIFILQPTAEGITVEEVVFVKNETNKTYNDTKGTYKFWVPDNAVGEPKVSLTSPDSQVPVQREPQKQGRSNIYTISWPMKPGETRVSISYNVQAGADRSFKSRILDNAPTTRVVVPIGVTATGDNVTEAGQDPQNKAMIYNVTGKEFAVALKGEVAAAAGGGDDEDTGAPQVESTKPRIYEKLPIVVALSFGILAIGFVLMYRATPRKGSASR